MKHTQESNNVMANNYSSVALKNGSTIFLTHKNNIGVKYLQNEHTIANDFLLFDWEFFNNELEFE